MNKKLILVGAIIIIVIGFLSWNWLFCRFYVTSGNMAIVTAKVGQEMGPGQILAKNGQKGVLEQPLGPGRHYLNPFNYSHKIKPLWYIPPGKVGIVTSKIGTDLPSGEFLAQPGQKGIWRDPLGPGLYALNPDGYDIEIIDALSIPIGYVGVLTSLAGAIAPPGQFAKAGERGVMEDILQPGLYYQNPKAYKVDVIEIGVNQVSLYGKFGGTVLTKNTINSGNEAMSALQNKVIASQQAQRSEYIEKSRDMTKTPKEESKGKGTADSIAEFTLNQIVEFPSRDGFEISLDMTVEFELMPDKVAGIYRDYGDMPAVVDKILMPQILSVSRLKGSAYKATDFIVGIGREKFQDDLTGSLEQVLATKNIVVHDALIRHVNVPQAILDPLQNASIAGEQDLTNKERQITETKKAELNTQTQLIQQKSAEVNQETEKMKAVIEANTAKVVAEIEANMTKEIAGLERQSAEVLAEKAFILGEAKATALNMTGGEKAKGFEMKVKAMGDANSFTLSEFASDINPDMKIRIMHSGEGTLWTNGEFTKGEAQILKATKK